MTPSIVGVNSTFELTVDTLRPVHIAILRELEHDRRMEIHPQRKAFMRLGLIAPTEPPRPHGGPGRQATTGSSAAAYVGRQHDGARHR
jgi:hypothetical protein